MNRQRPLSSLTRKEIKERLTQKKINKTNRYSEAQNKNTLAGLIQTLIYVIIALVVFGFGGLAALRNYFNL